MAASAMDDVDLVLRTMAKTIVDNAVYFAELDGVVGDGDFGYSLRNGFEVVVSDYDSFDRSSVGAVLKKVGFVLSGKVGGVSGPIWGTAFLRAGAAAGDKTELTGADVIAILRAAVAGIMQRGGASLGRQDAPRRAGARHRHPGGRPGPARGGAGPRRRGAPGGGGRGHPGGRGHQADAGHARPGRLHRGAEHRLGRRRGDRDRRDPAERQRGLARASTSTRERTGT